MGEEETEETTQEDGDLASASNVRTITVRSALDGSCLAVDLRSRDLEIVTIPIAARNAVRKGKRFVPHKVDDAMTGRQNLITSLVDVNHRW